MKKILNCLVFLLLALTALGQGGIQTVESFAALRDIPVYTWNTNRTVQVKQYWAEQPNVGGGVFQLQYDEGFVEASPWTNIYSASVAKPGGVIKGAWVKIDTKSPFPITEAGGGQGTTFYARNAQAIQTLWDAGVPVLVPSGSYGFTNSVRFKSGSVLAGVGTNSVLVWLGKGKTAAITNAFNPAAPSYTMGVEFRNILIQSGNPYKNISTTETHTEYLVKCINLFQSSFENVHLDGSTTDCNKALIGFLGYGSDNCAALWIRACSFRQASGSGVILAWDSAGAAGANSANFSDCRIQANNRWGIEMLNLGPIGPDILSQFTFDTRGGSLTQWGLSGDVALNGTASQARLTYTHATGAGKITQASSNFWATVSPATAYRLVYHVREVTGTPTATVTNSFVNGGYNLILTEGLHTASITTTASPGNFIINASSTATATFSIDYIQLMSGSWITPFNAVYVSKSNIEGNGYDGGGEVYGDYVVACSFVDTSLEMALNTSYGMWFSTLAGGAFERVGFALADNPHPFFAGSAKNSKFSYLGFLGPPTNRTAFSTYSGFTACQFEQCNYPYTTPEGTALFRSTNPGLTDAQIVNQSWGTTASNDYGITNWWWSSGPYGIPVKLGVGTRNPAYTLDVAGTARTTGNMAVDGDVVLAGNIQAPGGLRLSSLVVTNLLTAGSLTINTNAGIATTLTTGASVTSASLAGTNTVTGGSVTGTTNVFAGNGSQAAPAFAASADTDTGIWFPAANSVALGAGNNASFLTVTSGNVGIGTTAPGLFKLNVYGADNNNLIASVNPSGPIMRLQANAAATYVQGVGNVPMFIANSGASGIITFNPNDVEKVRIQVDGNVGIGTTAPASRLHLASPDNTIAQTITIQTGEASITAADTFISFESATNQLGSIAGTAVPGVIAYNTFLGAHYTFTTNIMEIPEAARVGALLEIIPGRPKWQRTVRLPGYTNIVTITNMVSVTNIVDVQRTNIVIVTNLVDALKTNIFFVTNSFAVQVPRVTQNPVQALQTNAVPTIYWEASTKEHLWQTRVARGIPQNPRAIGVWAGRDSQERDSCASIGTFVMWVSDDAGDIALGDYLCSSSTVGCAQKQADAVRYSYTIGKATEPVDWTQEGGKKSKRISVLLVGD